MKIFLIFILLLLLPLAYSQNKQNFTRSQRQFKQRSSLIQQRASIPINRNLNRNRFSLVKARDSPLSDDGTQSSFNGEDFNPELLGGSPGNPGIKARINLPGFEQMGQLITPLLDREIRNARIPSISQCVPLINGCIQIFNIFISRYQSPQHIAVYPAEPNRIAIVVQNVNIGVTANLGGLINILVPMRLGGIAQVNAQQASLTVELSITTSQTGSPYIQVSGCTAKIRYLDVYIENGGFIGQMINTQFRQQVSKKIRKIASKQLCGQLPSIVDQKINSQLGGIPQTIPIMKMLKLAGGALGLSEESADSSLQSLACGSGFGGSRSSQQSLSYSSQSFSVPNPQSQQTFASNYGQQQLNPAPQNYGSQPSQSYSSNYGQQASPQSNAPVQNYNQGPADTSGYGRRRFSKVMVSGVPQVNNQFISNQHFINSANSRPIISNKRVKRAANGLSRSKITIYRSFRPRAYASSGLEVSGGEDSKPCEGCPGANKDTFSQLKEFTKNLDLSKLDDVSLNVQILQTYATRNDFTIDLKGEFSQNNQGGLPFNAYPMQFPSTTGNKMAEILISDYTINSLFYVLHKKQFLSFELGPDTPKIGSLLKTTCSEDYDYGLEDHGVELDEESTSERRRKLATKKLRSRRQALGNLADLGICFGDILPAAREKYPDQNITININTARAPSVIFSEKDGGTVILNLIADADLYTQSKHEKMGTIRVEATFELTVKFENKKLTGHGEITKLKLTNPDRNLGLNPDALNSLGNLGKDLVAKAANGVLEKGIPLEMPSGGATGLPIEFNNPEIKIVEHAIHLESDINIPPSIVEKIANGGGLANICQI